MNRTVTPELNPGQWVWRMEDNIPKKKQIHKVDIELTENDTVIRYCLKGESVNLRYPLKDLFTTKEELRDYVFSN